MDYLQALTPAGLLHSSTCDTPVGFGETFRQTMERQGYRVVRYSPEEAAALRPAPVIGRRETPQESAEFVNQTAPGQTALQAQVTLPELHQEITTPRLGRCTVTHFVTWPDGTRSAVARGPRGEGLAREWKAVPSLSVDMSPHTSPVTPEPEPQVIVEVPPVPVPPGPWVMPSLFEGLL